MLTEAERAKIQELLTALLIPARQKKVQHYCFEQLRTTILVDRVPAMG
jgi:hypothetical protein